MQYLLFLDILSQNGLKNSPSLPPSDITNVISTSITGELTLEKIIIMKKKILLKLGEIDNEIGVFNEFDEFLSKKSTKRLCFFQNT
nr:1836_t:CDS:2 [Entrophospora candida]